MSMLSFYGGPAGKDFTIARVFENKVALDADITLAEGSEIYAGDYVLISYGDPNTEDYAKNLAADTAAYSKSYNATIWKKVWNNGYAYENIVSIASSYPYFTAESVEASLPFGSTPQLEVDSSSLANPKLKLTMPASLVAGSDNTTQASAANSSPIVTPVYGGEQGNELSFHVTIPKGTTFTPSVSDEGVLSWVNDGGLANPASKSIKGQKGDTGISFAGIAYTPSSASGGENKFQIKYSDGSTGTETYSIKNGVDITDIEVQSSTADGGENVITFVKSDGTKLSPIGVRNGSKGSTGTIKSVTASIDDQVGTPAVTAILSGDASNADIAFDFKNLKGNPGTIEKVSAAVDNTGIETGDPSCVVTLGGTASNREIDLAFSHLVGKKGDRGEQGYYFTPSVSENGILSWMNNGDLDNPATVNITGPKGDAGVPATIEITSIAVDNGSSESGTPSAEVISGTVSPQDAKYSLAFHNLVGKTGPIGPRGYYFIPSVSSDGVISWNNNSGGELANPVAVNIRGPQGPVGNPLNIIANAAITPAEVAEDTLGAVSAYLESQGIGPGDGELVAVTYEKTENDSVAYWYFKIEGAWQRVQLSGGMGGAIVGTKVTDATADSKVYSAAYVNALEARIAALEETLTIGKISEIGGN